MQTVEVLHMNKGVGETSYAMNSAVQNNIISLAKAATRKAIVQTLCSIGSNWPMSMSIADLGCSSGPNALRVISEILDAVYATSTMVDRPVPELVIYLNDLFTNDFNTIFGTLPSFYRKQKQENKLGYSNCFVSAVPGTFYERLFPTKSLHFVHSSSSLHWLSQVPGGLLGRVLNKGKIYISKSSPPCVAEAYSTQFCSDFSQFLESRSQEMVPGGRMVLSLMGRDSVDPTTPHSCYQWELLAQALMSMVSEGLVEGEKVDSFDAPYYAPCIEELKLEIQKEGSFMVESHEAYAIDWDGGDMELMHTNSNNNNNNNNRGGPVMGGMMVSSSSGERVARTIRAVVESMLESHFGSHIMDELFRRFGDLVEDHLSKTRTKYINLVISLVKQW